MPFDEVVDTGFFKALFQSVETAERGVDNGPPVKYIPLGSTSNLLSTDTLIVRPSYMHLLPYIHNSLHLQRKEDFFRCAVTGTPGIGKTVFGAYLLRHFVVHHHETVLYWIKGVMYLFSFNPEVKDFFALSDSDLILLPNSSLYHGKWVVEETTHTSNVIFSARRFNIIFIHDPNEDDRKVSDLRPYISRLIFILSHGHSLISHWNSKGNEMKFFYMPIWTKPEAERCLDFLKPQSSSNPEIISLADLPQEKVDTLHRCFGGCIRGWVNDNLWQELEGKITEVASLQGDNVLQKTPSSGSSAIHLEVDFDENRPILGQSEIAGRVEVPNSFDDFQCIFGSENTLELFREKILSRGEEALRMCLANWAGQSGFESVYGALFELHCHRMLESNTGQLKLKMRVVYSDKTKNTDTVHQVVIPETRGTLRYPSNDPGILEEGEYEEEVKTLSKYFWPISSNHPTYDSAFVVNGKDLGVKELEEEKIALLLQMTVSGATGLPRRPEHSVKQHIRMKFESVFKNNVPGYIQNGKAYTAFLVPTECFRPFLFQEEENMKGDTSKTQPKMQLVFEIPKIFTYRKGSPRGTSAAVVSFANSGKKRKRFHTFDAELHAQDLHVESS